MKETTRWKRSYVQRQGTRRRSLHRRRCASVAKGRRHDGCYVAEWLFGPAVCCNSGAPVWCSTPPPTTAQSARCGWPPALEIPQPVVEGPTRPPLPATQRTTCGHGATVARRRLWPRRPARLQHPPRPRAARVSTPAAPALESSGEGGGHCISLSGQKDTILSTQPICMEGGAPGPAKSRREVAPPLRPPLTPVCMTCACKSKHKKIGKTMPRASRMTAAGRFGGAGQVSTAELCRRPRSTADGWRHTWPRGCAAASS